MELREKIIVPNVMLSLINLGDYFVCVNVFFIIWLDEICQGFAISSGLLLLPKLFRADVFHINTYLHGD